MTVDRLPKRTVDRDLSVVIPVFNEEAVLEKLAARLFPVLDAVGARYEVVFIDDGSSDDTLVRLNGLRETYPNKIRIIRLAKNFGQVPAMFAGFQYARGERIVTLDADLQNPPEEIPRLLAKMDEGYDLVVGRREVRHDSELRKIPSRLFNKIAACVTGVSLSDYGSNLRAYEGDVIDHMLLYGEETQHISALTSWMGIRVVEIPVKHEERHAGSSKYRFLKLYWLIFNLITGYSVAPMQLTSFIGMMTAFVGLLMSVILLFRRFALGIKNDLIFALAIIFFLFGILIISVGIVGEYVVRIYRTVQRRPFYTIREIIE